MGELNSYGSDRFLRLAKSLRWSLKHHPMRSEIYSIRLIAEAPAGPVIMIYLAATTLAEVSRGLVEWDKTLRTQRITARRSTCGATLHLTLAGIADQYNTAVEVWGTILFNQQRTGLILDPDQQGSLTVGQLAGWMLDGWMPDHPMYRHTLDSGGDKSERTTAP